MGMNGFMGVNGFMGMNGWIYGVNEFMEVNE